jgi:cyclopropane-fatty-acyl-phospholipid synthase
MTLSAMTTIHHHFLSCRELFTLNQLPMISSKNTIGASAEAIQHHYDISNDFYGLWLDMTRTYSSALWGENDSLESAQIRKINYHIREAGVSAGDRVLDIGCGWGALLKQLVEVYDIRAGVGLTLSQAQEEYINALRLPRVEIYRESWLNHTPQSSYDAIISIGAFEHFAKLHITQDEKLDGYRQFFRTCHKWLKPSGRISLQTIVYENSCKENFSQFFEQEIFPESDLPRLWEILQATDRIFELERLRNDREDYKRTFEAWLQRLRQNRIAAVKSVGEKTVERYELFFRLAIHGLHTGTMNLSRLTFRRINI